MSEISSLREFLVSPSLQEHRQEVAAHMDVVQQVSLGTGWASGALGLYGVLLAQGWPVVGSGLAVLGVGGVLVSREVFLLARNYAHMLRASILDRGLWAASRTACLQRLAQDCTVAEVFLASRI